MAALLFRPPPAGELRALLAEGLHLWRLGAGQDWRALLVRRYRTPPPHRGPHGQPRVAGLAVAHADSGAWRALAVAESGPLGLDLECVRALRCREALLRRCFAAEEREALAAAGDRLLLRCWTLKEAVVKAHGRGLAYGLARIVTRPRGEWPELAAIAGEAGPAARWAVLGFELAEGCDATLVQPSPARPVLAFDGTAEPAA